MDQGIEHSGAASFAPNPAYFDPEKIIELAVEGGCNAVATTFGVLGVMSRKYAHRIPFIVKLNHNEMLSYPNTYDQIMYGSVQQAWDLGAAGVGATIYYGSEESHRQIQEVSEAFAEAHELGMFTVLWCYLRNSAFKVDGVDYHDAADLTGQANHMGVTIEADIIKQKLPTRNGGYNALEGYGKTSKLVYGDLVTDNPIDLCRWQVANNLHGQDRAHQQRRRLQRGHRPGRGRAHRRHQQAGRWHRPHQRPQGVPEAHGRGRRPAQRHPGRVPRRQRHHRLTGTPASTGPTTGAAPAAPRGAPGVGVRRASEATVGWPMAHGTWAGRHKGVVMTDVARRPEVTELDRVIIRFAGDSGDGMQLTGDRFTSVSAVMGNDLVTLPDFPAEIRGAGRHAGRGLGVPDPDLRPRHHHAG